MEKNIGKQLPNGSYKKGYSDTGFCYKNYDNFQNKSGVCYIPQDSDDKYTYQDFIDLCGGNQEVAKILFSLVKWNTPESEIQVGLEILGIFPCQQCGPKCKCQKLYFET
jgi:hypothetical protein